MYLYTPAILILLFTYQQATSHDVLKTEIGECFNKTCPIGSYSCKKHSYLSKDRQLLHTNILCLDFDKFPLQIYNETTTNPYRRDLSFESYSFSSVYLFERRIPTTGYGYKSRDATSDPADADITNKENAIK